MKKFCIASVIIIALISIGAVPAEEETGPPDFRQATWGMTVKQVKEAEKSAKLDGELPGLLSYDGEIAGIRAWILYLFDEDKLVRGIYSIETSQDTIIKDYETIRAFMLKQYGEPAEVKMGPKDEMFTGDLDPGNPEDLYSLVLRKSISPETIWETGRTRIYLQLIEKDGRVAITIGYVQPGGPG